MTRLRANEHVLWVSSNNLYLAVVLQIFCNVWKIKHFGYCYMDSFWPQSGRDVQDNWMLRFCLFSCEKNWSQYGHFLRMWAPLTCQRVKDYLCALPHLRLILSMRCYQLSPHLKISPWNKHVIDTTICCGFELNENYSYRRILTFLKVPK